MKRMANNSLRSFASGMIIATSIFTAVYYFQPSKEEDQKIVEPHTITEEEVQNYLKEKGYISIPKQTYDQLVAKAESSKPINKENNGNQVPETQQQATQSTKPTQPDPEKKEQPQQKIYTLTVKSGMDSIQIAKILENNDIVDNGDSFEQFLTKRDWTRSIQVGTYNLNSTMSYEEIGRIITKKK